MMQANHPHIVRIVDLYCNARHVDIVSIMLDAIIFSIGEMKIQNSNSYRQVPLKG